MIPHPTTRDGRNLDPGLADERGEATDVEVERPVTGAEQHGPAPSDTYYDLPAVKAAPWGALIPAYFYAGGIAGASATMGAAAELAGDRAFARRLHVIAACAAAVGTGCLVGDLGKPSRFHHMLRVFRPTSPMNLGTWIFTVAAGSTGLALVARRRRFGPASAIGAVAGSLLATYAGVLVGNTANPLWSATRRALPLHFAASSATALASLLDLVGPTRRGYGAAARVAKLVTTAAVERTARASGVDRPLSEGRSGRMWRGAKWANLASLAASLLGRPRLAGVLGTAASLLSRFAIVEAGRASAADPRATFEPQRARTAR